MLAGVAAAFIAAVVALYVFQVRSAGLRQREWLDGFEWFDESTGDATSSTTAARRNAGTGAPNEAATG